jgi:ribosome biogenesis GTPase / thiamine phosphate phosphatase
LHLRKLLDCHASHRHRANDTIMIDIPFERFSSLGMTSAVAQHLSLQPTPPGGPHLLARVIEVHRDSLVLHDGNAAQTARLLPGLARALLDGASALSVGDWVLCATDAYAQVWVHARLEPVTHIVRRDGDGRRHSVVSNIDTALLVMGLDLDFNPQRLERYLALIHGSSVVPVVVLSKLDVLMSADQADGDSMDGHDLLDQRIQQLRSRIGQRVDLVAVDARDADCRKLLAPYLGAGQTLVLLGSSGAGKSTLINTLTDSNVQDTGQVREHDSRGKHTTTSRSLHQLPGGACVIDTPGVRTLGLDMNTATLQSLFDDVVALSTDCRFRNCQHQDEPGCAVRAGVHPERLRNYQKLLRESRRDTLTPLERQAQLAQWKARSRASRIQSHKISSN